MAVMNRKPHEAWGAWGTTFGCFGSEVSKIWNIQKGVGQGAGDWVRKTRDFLRKSPSLPKANGASVPAPATMSSPKAIEAGLWILRGSRLWIPMHWSLIIMVSTYIIFDWYSICWSTTWLIYLTPSTLHQWQHWHRGQMNVRSGRMCLSKVGVLLCWAGLRNWLELVEYFYDFRWSKVEEDACNLFLCPHLDIEKLTNRQCQQCQQCQQCHFSAQRPSGPCGPQPVKKLRWADSGERSHGIPGLGDPGAGCPAHGFGGLGWGHDPGAVARFAAVSWSGISMEITWIDIEKHIILTIIV